jgi:hypothetical protein
MSEEAEQLTGVREREQFLGFQRRDPTESAPEPQKVYEGSDGITEAANDLTAARKAAGGEQLEPQKVAYTDGERKSLTPEQAAHDLSVFHQQQRAAEELGDLANLQSEVDLVRALYGPDGKPKIDRKSSKTPCKLDSSHLRLKHRSRKARRSANSQRAAFLRGSRRHWPTLKSGPSRSSNSASFRRLRNLIQTAWQRTR